MILLRTVGHADMQLDRLRGAHQDGRAEGILTG